MNSDEDRRLLPTIIQGGMGIAVSQWRLAQAVAKRGQLGVVSGTAIERVVACRLQEGDPGGHVRNALDVLRRNSIPSKAGPQPSLLVSQPRYLGSSNP